MKAYELLWKPPPGTGSWRTVYLSLSRVSVEQRESKFYEGEQCSCTKIVEHELEDENPIVSLAEAAKAFVDLDDSIHSAPNGESWDVTSDRARQYTQARKDLLLKVRNVLS